MPSLAAVLRPDGTRSEIGIDHARSIPGGMELRGEGGGFSATATWRAVGEHHEVALRVVAGQEVEAGLRVEAAIAGGGRPRWLIPGCFYGENRLPSNRVVFPRWDPEGGDPGQLVSDSWSFRADRSALPAVMAWSDTTFAALAIDEQGPLGEQGIGFRGDASGATIWVDAPYREEPATYVGAGRGGPADRRFHAWRAGDEATLRLSVAVAPPDLHAYAPFVRAMHAAREAAHPRNPWMSPAAAAGLAAEGLLRWHYDADDRILIETAAFDREAAARLDRRNMHVAWISGAPAAHALLLHGLRTAGSAAVDAASAVLDTISSGIAPCGAFWGEWRSGSGWGAGWNGDPARLHARTLAEATLFMLRALRADPQPRPAWEAAVRSNLAFVVGRQRDDGNLGASYHAHSGEVVGWAGAAGVPWIAALAEAAEAFGAPELLAAAERAGAHYARFVDDELIYGAPEDVDLTPTSEDGYNAVLAYVALADATGEARWVELARRAADWMLTFRYAYNVTFAPDTILAAYDFRTRGGDMASPANQHLHGYGLICMPEMFRLSELTGDPHYRDRAEENLACFLQLVARRDGDFNARRGMVSERFYQTEWAGPKGGMLTLSHAWSVGLLLYACERRLAR